MEMLSTEILSIIVRAFCSIIILFVLTKFMGKKQLSQLNFFDYCIGISIGSIAATLALDIEVDFLHPIIAMIVYGLTAMAISFATRKSMSLRRLLTGKATILMEKGKIYYDNLKKTNMDLNDFMTECRNLGYFNLDDIECAIMETNGKISVMPKCEKRPVCPQDMGISPNQDSLVTNLIIDGVLLKQNLHSTGKNEEWLMNMIKAHGLNSYKDVMLAGVDKDNKFSIYKYIRPETQNSIFE